jgi:hypothetical protein
MHRDRVQECDEIVRMYDVTPMGGILHFLRYSIGTDKTPVLERSKRATRGAAEIRLRRWKTYGRIGCLQSKMISRCLSHGVSTCSTITTFPEGV